MTRGRRDTARNQSPNKQTSTMTETRHDTRARVTRCRQNHQTNTTRGDTARKRVTRGAASHRFCRRARWLRRGARDARAPVPRADGATPRLARPAPRRHRGRRRRRSRQGGGGGSERAKDGSMRPTKRPAGTANGREVGSVSLSFSLSLSLSRARARFIIFLFFVFSLALSLSLTHTLPRLIIFLFYYICFTFSLSLTFLGSSSSYSLSIPDFFFSLSLSLIFPLSLPFSLFLLHSSPPGARCRCPRRRRARCGNRRARSGRCST